MYKFLFLILCFFCIEFVATAQNQRKLDSLNHLYQIAEQDTSKIIALNLIASQYVTTKVDTAIIITQKALKLSETTKFKKGIGNSLYNLASCYFAKGNYPLALELNQKNIKIQEERNDKKLLGSILNNMGLIYKYQANYILALEYYLKSLKLSEDLKELKTTATRMNNIGSVYNNLENDELALKYYTKSLAISEGLNDKRSVAGTLNNIGTIYQRQNNYELSLENFKRSLKILEEVKDKRAIPTLLGNISSVYFDKGDYDLAKEYAEQCMQLGEENKDKISIVQSSHNLAQIFIAQKNYDKGIEYVEKALIIEKERKMLLSMRTSYGLLYTAYKGKENYSSALIYHELLKQINDSIFNIENTKSIANLESKMTLEKKEKELALLSKDNELNKIETEKQAKELLIAQKQAEAEHFLALAQQEKDKRKQDSLLNLAQKSKLEAENLHIQKESQEMAFHSERLQQNRVQNAYLFIVFASLVVLILVALGLKQKQKANKILAIKNEEISKHREDLLTLTENLEMQKQVVTSTYEKLKKTTDILDNSIQYASQIQSIVMPEEAELRNFFSDLFIIFRPKDVVSGDFYWFSQISDNWAVFCMADCTGHGVPGAFMSMLGSTILHEIVNVKKNQDDPATILKELHAGIRKMLKQDKRKNNDGMDISICVFKKDKENQAIELIFAGAKSTISYITKDEIYDLKGDKQYLGGEEMQQEFTNKHFILPENTTFYLYTDGYQDQNNPNRKRMGSKGLKAELLTCVNLPFYAQKTHLENVLDQFQDGAEQRDDISVIGLRF